MPSVKTPLPKTPVSPRPSVGSAGRAAQNKAPAIDPQKRADELDDDDREVRADTPAGGQGTSKASTRTTFEPVQSKQHRQHHQKPAFVDTKAGEQTPGTKADPIGLHALQERPSEGPVAVFAEKLNALAAGIDAKVVHGKRLDTILRQLPALSYGDIDRLWRPETHAAFANERQAYIDALDNLSKVAPELEIPPMGQQALEAARMNALHDALLTGDVESAHRIGQDAAALFPDSPLVTFYLNPLGFSDSPNVEPSVAGNGPEDADAGLAATLQKVVTEVKSGTLDATSVQSALEDLTFPQEGFTALNFVEQFEALADVAPNAVIFGDQTLAEALLYSQVLSAQQRDATGEVRELAGSFLERFPQSARATWVKDIMLDA